MAEGNIGTSLAEWVARARSLKVRGDMKSAIKICHEGLKAHPKSTDLLFTYGELRVACYNRVKKPEHLKVALVSFERLLKVNPHHYMANLLSAQIYLKGRVYDRAQERIEGLLKASPDDPRALKIMLTLQEKVKPSSNVAPRTAERKQADIRMEPSATIETENLEGLQEAANDDMESLIDKLSHFSRLEGLVSMHILDTAGIAIKSVVRSGKVKGGLASIMADVFRSSGYCVRKAGLGNFQRGIIQTPMGNIVIVNVFYGILVIALKVDADMHDVEKRVNRYIEDLVR